MQRVLRVRVARSVTSRPARGRSTDVTPRASPQVIDRRDASGGAALVTGRALRGRIGRRRPRRSEAKHKEVLTFDTLEMSLTVLERLAPLEPKLRLRRKWLADEVGRAAESIALNVSEARQRAGLDRAACSAVLPARQASSPRRCASRGHAAASRPPTSPPSMQCWTGCCGSSRSERSPGRGAARGSRASTPCQLLGIDRNATRRPGLGPAPAFAPRRPEQAPGRHPEPSSEVAGSVFSSRSRRAESCPGSQSAMPSASGSCRARLHTAIFFVAVAR